MSSFKKFVVLALTVFTGVAANAKVAEAPRAGGPLAVVSSQGHAPSLDAVHYTGHRHHHRRAHRAHPVRHVR